MGDVKNYDYGVLDECINMMKQKSSEIETQCGNLAAQVNELMGTWTGSTATMYNTTADDLKAEMERANQNLELTRQALHGGSTNMQDTDARGSKNIAQ
jgi:WXG100 family type VII secretion target